MAQIDDLLAVLDLRGRDARKAERRLYAMPAICLVFFVVLFAAALWTGIAALQYGWQTGQWGAEYQVKLLTFIVLPAQCLLPWVYVVLQPLVHPTLRQLTAAAAMLGESAADGLHDIPVATNVLTVPDSIAAPLSPAEFGPFHRVNSTLRINDVILGVFLLFCSVLLGGAITILLIFDPKAPAWPYGLVFGGIALALCMAGVALLAEVWRLGRPVRIQTDEMGLRWERVFPRRRAVSMLWGAIRAIFVISHTRGLNRHLACIVDGGDSVLVFDLGPKAGDAEVNSAHRLVKLVLARTGLPLLDQTKLAENLYARRSSTQYRTAYEMLAQPGAMSRSIALRLPHPILARQVKRTVITFLLPLVLIPVCVLSGVGLHYYQKQTYGALLAEARTHTPLYHDALTGPDADWQAHGPTSDDPNSYAFANGGYLITPAPSASANSDSDSDQQNSPFIEVYAPGVYRDAVVEVRVRMAPGGVPYGAAGLALRALLGNAGGNLHFGINGDGSWGTWDFAHCPPTPTGPGDSTCGYDSTDQVSAIHHADWAPNRLTAILRGNQVICFINNVYVGSVVDLGLQSGRLGFGVEGLGAPVAFSDFTIYPL